MKPLLRSVIAGTLIWSTAIGCHRSSPSESAKVAEPAPSVGDSRAKGPQVLALSEAIVRDAHIETAVVQKRRLSATVDLNGQLVADPDHIAMLGARVPGRVVKVLVREGDRVNAGQILAVLTSPELAKQRTTYAAICTKASAARRNAENLRSLVADRLAAEQDALGAEADAQAAEAERDAVLQMIKGMGAPAVVEGDPSIATLVSSTAGHVVLRDAVPGQLVEPSHTLLTVADLSKLWFQAQLFEKDLSQIREGADTEIRLNGYPGNVFLARVARVSSQVDPQSHTLTARLELAKASPLFRLGLFGRARVSTGESAREEQLAVPLSAVTDLGERTVVFVRAPEGHFEVRDVTIGPTASGQAVILSGLEPGEQVVVTGAFTLKAVLLKSTLQEED